MLANVYLKVEDSVLSSPEVAEHSMKESKPRKDRGTIVCTTIDHNRRVVFFFLFLSDIPHPALHYVADVQFFFTSHLLSNEIWHKHWCNISTSIASHPLLAEQHGALVAFSIALICLPACENLPHIVKLSSHLLVKHGFLIKWNIFFFTAFDYALLHSLSAANNSDNLLVHRYTILIIRWWTPVLRLSHYSIILF